MCQGLHCVVRIGPEGGALFVMDDAGMRVAIASGHTGYSSFFRITTPNLSKPVFDAHSSFHALTPCTGPRTTHQAIPSSALRELSQVVL